MATKNGLVKKTRLSQYSNPRATGVIAINLDPNDAVIGVVLTAGQDHIILGTRDGMTIRFDEQEVRSMGRASRGVRGIKLRPNDEVVGMVIPTEKASLFTVCENGYGKRTGVESYRSQTRGGVGLKNIKTSARNGKVVALEGRRGGRRPDADHGRRYDYPHRAGRDPLHRPQHAGRAADQAQGRRQARGRREDRRRRPRRRRGESGPEDKKNAIGPYGTE